MLVRDPIYQQVNQALREMIRSGEYAAGTQFLTERQICERFEVSRATANKALSNLVSEGLLEFRKGIGTFVRGNTLDYDLAALVSFTEKALVAGKQPSTRVLRLATVTTAELGPEAATGMAVVAEESLYYVERLRLADDLPVILERRHMVARYCPGLTVDALQASLYTLWTRTYGLSIAGADQRIRAVAIRGGDARLLCVRAGSPGFLVLATGFLSGGVPLWYERTLYRGDAYEFHNRQGPVQTARPVAGSFLDVNKATTERLTG